MRKQLVLDSLRQPRATLRKPALSTWLHGSAQYLSAGKKETDKHVSAENRRHAE
jgi:hypothetical protein